MFITEKINRQRKQFERRTNKTYNGDVKGLERRRHECADRLMPLVYDGLREIAAQYLRRQRSDHTFQPTALVNEAYMKLIDVSDVNWQDRAHFFASLRRRCGIFWLTTPAPVLTEKRGGDLQKSLDEAD